MRGTPYSVWEWTGLDVTIKGKGFDIFGEG